jgi:hypothetical protein
MAAEGGREPDAEYVGKRTTRIPRMPASWYDLNCKR